MIIRIPVTVYKWQPNYPLSEEEYNDIKSSEESSFSADVDIIESKEMTEFDEKSPIKAMLNKFYIVALLGSFPICFLSFAGDDLNGPLLLFGMGMMFFSVGYALTGGASFQMSKQHLKNFQKERRKSLIAEMSKIKSSSSYTEYSSR